MKDMSITAIVLSGGLGTRISSEVPKQYISVGGKMIITYCLETIISHEEIDRVLIVADKGWRDEIIYDIDNYIKCRKSVEFVDPGETRQMSVFNALEYINCSVNEYGETDAVMIHDAARPLLSAAIINQLIKEMIGYDGVMPGLPMKDTVYISESGEWIEKNISRNSLVAGQTPEIFMFEKYYNANINLLPNDIKKIHGSSEPAVIAGMRIRIVEGSENNYKITTNKDLEKFVEFIG